MKTYLAKDGDVERKHVLFDAADVPLGRLAVRIANTLRGKDKNKDLNQGKRTCPESSKSKK